MQEVMLFEAERLWWSELSSNFFVAAVQIPQTL